MESRAEQGNQGTWSEDLREPHLILGLGELLWDVLPEGPRLGGAPANFSVMAGRLGNHAVLLSRIGRDELGRTAVERLDPLPVDASFVETDPLHETGRVTVNFEGGQPHYTIHQPAAWDFLELTDEWVRLAERADAICFGSLAQRSRESRQTIQTLAAQTSAKCVRVFDANLIWSDLSTSANMWGCFCRCRCFGCFPRAGPAAVEAVLSDD